jgi:flagellar hook-associated protein 2
VSTNINVTLNAGDSNQTVLTNIAAAINGAGIGATAAVANETGTSSRLVLTSSTSGIANTMTIQDTAGTLMQNAQVINGSGTLLNQLQAADDARFTIDSLSYQRSTNTVSDAITGVTMQLKSLASGTLTVSADTSTITQSIQDFIDAYNAVIDNLVTETGYNVDTKESGDLLHYSVARNMKSELRSMVSTPVAGLPAAYNSLAMIGIDTDKTGKLSIVDSTKLDNALNSSLSSVAAILNDPTDGVAVRVQNYVNNTTSLTGALTLAINNDNTQLQSLSYLLTRKQQALTDYEYKLNIQYSALQSLLTNNQSLLNSLSSFSLMPSVA